MRKKKALISAVFILALLFGAYYLADSTAWFKQQESGGQNEVGGQGDGTETASPSPEITPEPSSSAEPTPSETSSSNGQGGEPSAEPKPTPTNGGQGANSGSGGDQSGEDITVVGEPSSMTVLVNPRYKLPEDYAPDDLVYPDVRFTFSEKIEKRMLRKEAAEALESMFAAAEKDKIYLAGVSGYRSHDTQTKLFERYVKRDGYEKARTYSALPGTSEHETGLAIDVSGSDGKCAAADCFGDTKEAAWLAGHAAEFGFIIRYPKGKEDITGYQFEPWHLRYVGTELAAELDAKALTLEEYFNATPVKASPNGG